VRGTGVLWAFPFKVHGTGVLWAFPFKVHGTDVLHGTVVLWASPFKVHGTVVLWHRYLGTGISGILALKYFGSAPIAERQMSPKAIAMN
jgi:hypothetical protein